MIYRSLQDAAKARRDPGFVRGQTRIWYVRPEYGRNYRMGYRWLREQGIPVPDATTLGQTHAKLGAISEDDPERVYSMLQGEYWSPKGEAVSLIAKRGLSHTSMGTGDILQMPDDELLMADPIGFVTLARAPNPFVKPHRPVLPVMTEGWPQLYNYNGWTIEVSPWPKYKPVEWMAQATHKRSGVQRKVFSDVGSNEALRAVKIHVDLFMETVSTGVIEMEQFWDYLKDLIQATATVEKLTRGNLARRIELARRQLGSQAYTVRVERGPIYDWFYAQPANWRVRFLDRAIEHYRLLHGPVAPHGVPRRGRPLPANLSRPVVNTRSLRNRLLR